MTAPAGAAIDEFEGEIVIVDDSIEGHRDHIHGGPLRVAMVDHDTLDRRR